MWFADCDFIPRQLEAVWAGGLAQQWGEWDLPEEEQEAPAPDEEAPPPNEGVHEVEELPDDMEELSEEIPIDLDIMEDDSGSDNNSSLTD